MIRYLLITFYFFLLCTSLGCGEIQDVNQYLKSSEPQYGGVLRIAQSGDPISCDLPMSRGTGYRSVHPCSPMLSQILTVSPKDHGVIVADLADEWEMSPNGEVWTFTIRENARWHDDSPVTASDLKFSLDRIISVPQGLAIGRASPIADYISSPDQIKVTEPNRLVITTDFSAASFIVNISSVYVSVYPVTHTLDLQPQSMVLHEQVVGSGPFKFHSAVSGSAYKMVRNNDYYDAMLPYLDGITYLVIPAPAVRMAGLKTQEIDMLMLVTESEAVDIEKEFPSEILMLREPSSGGNTIQMNLNVPPFDNPKVRRAINMTFDRDEARIALGGGFVGAIMPPGGPWALNSEQVSNLAGLGNPESDRLEARKLLEQSGYPKGFSVTLHTRSDTWSVSLAEFAASQLSKIGIQAKLAPLERVAYQDLLNRGQHAIISHSHSFAIDDPDSILPAHYLCGGSENWPQLCDPEIDTLIKQQSRTMNPVERKHIVNNIQRRIWNTDSKIWFNWSVRRTPVWNSVRNYVQGGSSLYQGRRMESVWLQR